MGLKIPLEDISRLLHSALDYVQTNIIIADGDFKIIYMNHKAEQTLKAIEDEIFEIFKIRVENFIGGSIHRFHRDRKRVEMLLRNPLALPHEAMFGFGDIHLKSSINSIVGPEGEITGYIVNWEDVSEKARLMEKISKKKAHDGYMEKLLLELRTLENINID